MECKKHGEVEVNIDANKYINKELAYFCKECLRNMEISMLELSFELPTGIYVSGAIHNEDKLRYKKIESEEFSDHVTQVYEDMQSGKIKETTKKLI